MAETERALMAEGVTNLRVIKPSRKKPQSGDIFAMQLPDETYLFGRVIRTDAVSGFGPPTAVLIYIYRVRSDVKAIPAREELRPERLLVSPIMTNRLPWSRGYFETIAALPLDSQDVLPRHCFSDAAVTGKYFDEYGNELPGVLEPCGDYGLSGYRSIDDRVSDALGIPRAPES